MSQYAELQVMLAVISTCSNFMLHLDKIRPRNAKAMRYQKVEAYWVGGLFEENKNESSTENFEREVIVDPIGNFKAILTNNPDPYLFEGDRGSAIPLLLARGELAQLDIYEEKIKTTILETQKSRRAKFCSGLYLILIMEGKIEQYEPSYKHEMEDFIIYFDNGSKNTKIKTLLQNSLFYSLTTLSSLILSIKQIYKLSKVNSFVTFFGDNNKPIYLVRLIVPGVRTYTPHPVTSETIKSIQKEYKIIATDRKLDRVQQLLIASFENEDDPLRAFLSSWTALEILINKISKPIQKKNIPEDESKLLFKFKQIALSLSPDSAEEDIGKFNDIRKERNNLIHGEDIIEDKLPIAMIQELTRKYLRLHLTANAKARCTA